MNLIIDLGNSYAKYYVFENSILIENHVLEHFNSNEKISKKMFEVINNRIFDGIIISSDVIYDEKFTNGLKLFFKNVVILNKETKLPIKILYKTPQTLGNDRKATSVGASILFPNTNVLIIDAGTAITYDILTEKNEFLGGNISPGLETRFKSLNNYTKKLPLLSSNELEKFYGESTDEAIILGVQNGLVYEIQGYIDEFVTKFNNNKIILTGGDCFFFEKRLKRIIFAVPNLISIGLNRILESNV